MRPQGLTMYRTAIIEYLGGRCQSAHNSLANYALLCRYCHRGILSPRTFDLACDLAERERIKLGEAIRICLAQEASEK